MQKVSSAVRVILLIGWLLSVFLINPMRAFACMCIVSASASAATELPNSAAVFAGEVVRVQNFPLRNLEVSTQTTFKVSQVWKGAVEPSITVNDGGQCAYGFVVGQQYLVYASEVGGELATPCTRILPLGYASEDLAYLGQGQAPPAAPMPPAGISAPVLIGISALIFMALTGVIVFLSRRLLR